MEINYIYKFISGIHKKQFNRRYGRQILRNPLGGGRGYVNPLSV